MMAEFFLDYLNYEILDDIFFKKNIENTTS
jgi:hypothetical protein